MLSASFDFRRAIAQNTKTLVKGTLTLADGTVRELTGDDLMMGSTSFTDSVSSAGSFDIGAAIIGRLSLSLNNYDGRFDSYDFEGAEIVPYVGVRLAGGIEWIRKGVYGIEQPETYGNVIGIGALDNMRKLERAYAGVATTYPATLGTIAQDICTHCGVTLATSDFANRSFVVQERPDDTSLTCIAMLAYVAQASGNWARCDVWGRVRLDWYDTSAFEGEAWLDGDRFDGASPYASGDTANGGDFSNYGAGATVDGGGFSLRPWAHVFALASLSVATDDVVVTGVRATAQDGEGDQAGESYLFGSEGYVLELPDNPLVQYGTAQAVASQVGARVVGMRFRPFDISALGDPTVEAGDPIIITDGKQRQYRSYLTTLTYKVGSYEAMACHAESPGRNRADSYTALTRALVKLRNADRDERSARELAVENLARQLAESSGLYMTSVPQQDGSSIYYMHDKPTLAQSQIVWKLTANAFGISTDGGRTYPYGLDVNGDAILNRIYAIGLNADYINAGSLTIRDGNTTVLSANAETGVVVLQDVSGNMWNMHTGQYRLAATSTIGGRTVSDVLDAVDATVTGMDVEYAQNQSRTNPPTTGWDTTAPAWQEGWYIWSRTATTTAEGTTYSDPVCISGRDGSTGTNAATIYLYQRATTAPARPSSSLTYTFSTGELAGSLGSWTRGIPDGADTCWVTVASAISNGDTDAIAPSEWSDPVELAAGGVDGLNQAFIYLHKRAWPWRARGSAIVAPSAAISVSGTTATVAGTVSGTTLTLASNVPAPPSGALTYTFATGVLSGNLEGWSRGVPDGDAPCWVTTAVAISSEATDLIGASEWAEVVKLVEDGEGSTVEAVEYAIGGSGTQAPTGGWGTTVPSVAPGMWLWTRTTYSEGDEAYTCAYMGTDGADGKSVAIRSVTKEGRTTTLVLASTDGTTETLTIVDGEDGDDGMAGASGYVHVAWANSADGTQGFSTHDSAGKTHIGVYTDNSEADSQSPADYSWSLIKGADGRGISSTVTSYGTSSSGTTWPTTWQTPIPSTTQGDWLWVRTLYTYTDGTTSTTYAHSYIGTDGQDGKSVVISNASKVGKVTTVTMQTVQDGVVVGTDTLTINDGSDGPRGMAGASGYVHVAWATSSDGTQGFSTTESAGKTYIGVYTDNEPNDSTYPIDYSWSKIKGETGTGVSAVVEQYYLSTSSTTQSGGSWSTAQPAWQSGRYIWTRSAVTWTDGRTTYTEPVLAKAINSANESAKGARDAVTALDESLTQLEIFNRLTNDGETQGIYLQNGKLYINGTYIKSGTIDGDLIRTGLVHFDDDGYIDFANGEMVLGSTSVMGGRTVNQVLGAVDATITGVSTDVEYAESQSGTTAPTTGWQTTAPAWRAGWYIWQRTRSSYTNASGTHTSYSQPTCISGRDGIDGTSVAVSRVEYGASTSASTQPSSWSQTAPTSIAKGLWLWVKTTYSDGSVATTKSYIGTDGQDGTDGVGVSSIVEQYYLSTSDSTTQDGTWTTTQPAWMAGRHIWTRSEITWTDGTMTHTAPALATALNDVSARSTENAEGIEGLQGDVGELSGSLDDERQQRASESASLSQYVYNLEGELDGREAEMRGLIDDARRYATDYLKYQNGELTLGATDSAIRQVLTNAQQVYRTDSGDVAWFGLNASGIWEMHIQTASVNDRLSFGDFSWIARQNGNMTLKWVG